MEETSPFVLLSLSGKDWKYRLTLNGIVYLQEKTGVSLENPALFSSKLRQDISFLRTLIWLGLKTYEKDLTEEAVGDMIDVSNLVEATNTIFTHMGFTQAATLKNSLRATVKKKTSPSPGRKPSKQPAKSESPPKNSTT